MSPTIPEAAAALEAVQQAKMRSRLVAQYAYGSIPLILWGAIWIAGYGTAFFVSHYAAGRLWPWLGVGGAVLSWSYVIFRRPKLAEFAPAGQRIGLFISFAFLAYTLLWFFLLMPLSYAQWTTFTTTIFMFAYVLGGIIGRARFFLWLGLSITALAFVNYLYGDPYFDLVQAGLGGFGLLGGGIYLSRWRQ